MGEYFVALVPEKRIYDKIKSAKEKIRKLIGPQLFLSDPPHLTLCTGKTKDIQAVAAALSSLEIKKIDSAMLGWHLFQEDKVTKKSTICFDVEKTKKIAMLQKIVLETLFPLREGILKRYVGVSFPKAEKNNLKKFGFPFVGKSWISHISLCSTDEKNITLIKKAIDVTKFKKELRFDKIVIYSLIKEKPSLVKEIKLK
jgi:hypothetical protein